MGLVVDPEVNVGQLRGKDEMPQVQGCPFDGDRLHACLFHGDYPGQSFLRNEGGESLLSALRLIVAGNGQLVVMKDVVVQHHDLLGQFEVAPILFPAYGLVARADWRGTEVNAELGGLRAFLAPRVGKGMELRVEHQVRRGSDLHGLAALFYPQVNLALGFDLLRPDVNIEPFGSKALARGVDFKRAMVVQVRVRGTRRLRQERQGRQRAGDEDCYYQCIVFCRGQFRLLSGQNPRVIPLLD